MKITVLCNAGLALEAENAILLVDAPNQAFPPFAALPEALWQDILERKPPYDRVCGLWFTHDHPDHCDLEKTRAYEQRWPEIPVLIPGPGHVRGRVQLGPFTMEYQRLEHAPMDEPTPPHVVTWISCGGKSIYIAGDAALDCEAHRAFLRGRTADAAFWNSMYLSRPDTRNLMAQAARQSCIYHMPPQEPDDFGLWKKCRSNLQRYPQELERVTVIERYPSEIQIG